MRRERRKDLLVWENSTTHGQIVSFPHSREARGADLGAVSPRRVPGGAQQLLEELGARWEARGCFPRSSRGHRALLEGAGGGGSRDGKQLPIPVLTEDEG